MPRDALTIARHNGRLMLREPGPVLSRLILPLVFLLILRPLYEQAQGTEAGTTQAVVGTLVTFSLLALSIVGGAILSERLWHTWERVRSTAIRPGELLAGKAAPVMLALFAQQVVIISFGCALGLRVADLPMLVVALLAWTMTLLGLGALLGVLARSLGELSAGYDIGGMLLSSLGGALVPLAAMPHWVRDIAPGSPSYWAVSALKAALRGDSGRTLESAAVMAAFAVAFGLLAAVRVRRGWGRSTTL